MADHNWDTSQWRITIGKHHKPLTWKDDLNEINVNLTLWKRVRKSKGEEQLEAQAERKSDFAAKGLKMDQEFKVAAEYEFSFHFSWISPSVFRTFLEGKLLLEGVEVAQIVFQIFMLPIQVLP